MSDLSITHATDEHTVDRGATPSSEVLEQSVLGGILVASKQHPEMLDEVMEMLQPQDFYIKQHQAIYRVAQQGFGREGTLDALTVQTDLLSDADAARFPNIDGYVQQLTDNVADLIQLVPHARAVRALSMRRSLIDAATWIQEQATYPKDDNIDQLINDAEHKVLKVIEDRGTDDSMRSADLIVVDTLDALEKLYKNQQEYTGLRTGFPWLDDITSGLQVGDLIVLAARPGVGKTSMAINIIEYALTHMEQTKAPTIMFSMEMSSTQVVQRFLSSLSSIHLNVMRNGKLSSSDWDKLQNAAKRIQGMQHLYIDTRGVLDVGMVRHRVRRVKNLHKNSPALIVVDYLQLMGAASSIGAREENRNQEISRITRSLKGIAKEFECPVLLLSQLSRQGQQAKRKPALIDLRDSGAIEQDADIVLFLHQKDEGLPPPNQGQREVELIIAKHRNGEIGHRMLNFHGPRTRFTEATLEDYDNNSNPSSRTTRRSDPMEDL